MPRFSFAEPRNPITNASYPVGSQVPYRCRPGYVGVSDKSFLVTCLPNNTWAWDPDFCIGECPPRPAAMGYKGVMVRGCGPQAPLGAQCGFGGAAWDALFGGADSKHLPRVSA